VSDARPCVKGNANSAPPTPNSAPPTPNSAPPTPNSEISAERLPSKIHSTNDESPKTAPDENQPKESPNIPPKSPPKMSPAKTTPRSSPMHRETSSSSLPASEKSAETVPPITDTESPREIPRGELAVERVVKNTSKLVSPPSPSSSPSPGKGESEGGETSVRDDETDYNGKSGIRSESGPIQSSPPSPSPSSSSSPGKGESEGGETSVRGDETDYNGKSGIRSESSLERHSLTENQASPNSNKQSVHSPDGSPTKPSEARDGEMKAEGKDCPHHTDDNGRVQDPRPESSKRERGSSVDTKSVGSAGSARSGASRSSERQMSQPQPESECKASPDPMEKKRKDSSGSVASLKSVDGTRRAETKSRGVKGVPLVYSIVAN